MRGRALKAFLIVTAIVVAVIWIAMAYVAGVPLEFSLANPLMAMYALIPSRNAVRQALRNHAEAQGQDPDLIDAIAWVESRWKLNAIGDKGTSFGPTQLHLPTLKRIGFTGDPKILTTNADAAGDWSAQLMALNSPDTTEDAASLWNSGKRYSDLPEGHPTIAYVALVKDALAHLPSVKETT